MINWKLRLKNKTTLTSLIILIISFVYKILDLLHVIPPFPQESIVEILGLLIDILCFLGIVVDPTTAGIVDSNRAMGYEVPNNDRIEETKKED
jgi:phi LC3 family holin